MTASSDDDAPRAVTAADGDGAFTCCPECGDTLEFSAAGAICAGCSERFSADDVGILRLSGSNQPWRGIRSEVSAALSRLNSGDELLEALARALPEEPQSTVEQLHWRLTAPRHLGLAALAPADPGGRALLLGGFWIGLGRALQLLGYSVCLADTSYERLRAARLLDAPAGANAVHLTPSLPLPFAGAAFQVVFIDIEDLGLGLARETGAGALGRAQRQLWQELGRLIRPGGSAIAVTANPLRSLGRCQALRHLLARRLDPSGRRMLRSTALTPVRTYVPIPRSTAWRRLVPQERLASDTHTATATDERGRISSLRRRGRLHGRWAVHDYILVARQGGRRAGQGGPTLAEALILDSDGLPPTIRPLSGDRFGVSGEDCFVKFPLSPEMQERALQEVEATRSAHASAFAAAVVPWVKLGDWHGRPYGLFPNVSDDSSAAPPEEVGQALATFLSQLPSTTDRLATTELWPCLEHDATRATARSFDAEDLLDYMLDHTSHMRLPIGPSHGDLGLQNIFLRASGHLTIVDWDQGVKERDPLLIDALQAADSYSCMVLGMKPIDAIEALGAGALTHPLARRVYETLGELNRPQALALAMLHRLAGPNELPTSERARAHLRQVAAIIRELIGAAGDGGQTT